MADDVIALLEHDHREVEEMFEEFGQAVEPQDCRAIADRIIIELVRHTECEEQLVYPVMREVLDDGETLVEHELSEHSAAERIMKQLDGMDPGLPDFGVLMGELQAAIRAHIREEEGDAFPRFRQQVDQDKLETMAVAVQALKKIVPTRPHPMALDRPPLNALLGPGTGLLDRVRDVLTGRGKT